MADLTITELVRNTGTEVAFEAGAASQTIPLSDVADRHVLLVRNTDANTVLITVKAGDYPASALGDLTQEIAQNEVFAFNVDGSRFKDSDSDLTIEAADPDGSVFSGTITNVEMMVIQTPGITP
jgi:hypothetical protein